MKSQILALLIVGGILPGGALLASDPCPAFVAVIPTKLGQAQGHPQRTVLLSLQPNPASTAPLNEADVELLKDDDHTIEPSKVKLHAAQQTKVVITATGDGNTGLFHLSGTAIAPTPACVHPDTSIDLGFKTVVAVQIDPDYARLFSRAPDDPPAGGSLDSKNPQLLRIGLFFKDGHEWSYEDAITTTVYSDSALLSEDSKKWQPKFTATLAGGHHWLQPFYVKPIRMSGSGSVRLDFGTPDPSGEPFSSESIRFSVHPPWLPRVLIGFLGGLLYAILALLGDQVAKRNADHAVGRLVIGAAVGVLAALLIEKGWLPIKIGQADLPAYLLIGFMMASIGIDGILTRIKGKTA